MADRIQKFVGIAPGDLPMKYKDVNGDETVFAPVVALEPASIGGGGAGGGGPADTAASATASEADITRQKVTAALRLYDAAGGAGARLVTAPGDQTSGLWVNVKALPAIGGTVAVSNFPATQPVSGTVNVGNFPATEDISDRVGRLLGHVTVDNASLAVTGTFWQATQPVSLATNTPDVTDRAARLLGRTRLTDDTNLSTIKAASTTPVATDTALVVTLSPNGAAQPVTATQPVSIAATVTTSEAAPTVITTGKTSTVTAGTRVQLAANAAKSITLKALAANTGTMYIGNSTVAASNGFALAAGDTVSLDISNSNVVFIDSSVSAEGVTWLVVN